MVNDLGTLKPLSVPHDGDTEPCFMHGHWYLRLDDRALFIVPDDGHGVAETYGPDDDTLAHLNGAYREYDQTADGWFDHVNCEAVAARLGLEVIHHWQRRADPCVGYFVV